MADPSPFDIPEQLTRIYKAIAETGKLQEESDKYRAESRKLQQESDKYAAELRKLDRENHWFPWLQLLSSSVLAALLASIITSIITNFWHG